MIKIMRNEIRKALLSPVFYISVLLMGLGYYFAQTDFTWVSDGVGVLQNTLGSSEWEIFGILGCTLPYAASFCQEYLAGNMQMSLERIGIKKYCMGKAAVCFFAGGLSAVLGRCFLLMLSTAHVPLLAEGSNWEIYQVTVYPYELLCNKKYGFYYCFQMFLCFLNGGFYASLGLFLSAFVISPFMAWFAPYIILLMFSISGFPAAVNPLLIEKGIRIFPSFWANVCYSSVFYFVTSFCFLYLFYHKVKRGVQHGWI